MRFPVWLRSNAGMGRALWLRMGTLWVLALALAPAATSAAAPTDVRAVRLWESPEYTRTVFDLGGVVEYKLFTLQNPDRVVLDLQGAKLATGYSAPKPHGRVLGLRSGQPTVDSLRVVIDVTPGTRPKSFLLPPVGKKNHRLVIDLYPRVATGPAQPARSVPAVASGPLRDVVIAIDAGHGGEDPGAIGAKGTREKNVTLAVARALAVAIDAEPGMRALLVRDGDYFIPHKQRYQKARDARADLFVSIHADAFTRRAASGSSVYILSQRGASSEAARWLAASENQSDLVGGVSLDDKDNTLAAVLLDLSQGATLGASDAVAASVLRSLARVGKVHSRNVQRANFVVLRSPDVPSILVETAFISNPAEERRLNDPGHQRVLAKAMLDGIRDYFHGSPPPDSWIAAHPQRPREHIVARGESLSLIAMRHRISLGELRRVNNLSTDMVRAGTVLRIPSES